MFAIVLPGRLPLTAPQQVDATHLVFPIEAASSVNHVTVFMDGTQAFPPGYSATVHFLWPQDAAGGLSGSNAKAGEWQMLGW